MLRNKPQKPARPPRENIKNLPNHAQYEFKRSEWYVYFPYSYVVVKDGKKKLVQERDYIGTLSADGTEFLPNEKHRLRGYPSWENRPAHLWKNPQKRAEAQALQAAVQAIKSTKASSNPAQEAAPETGPETAPDVDEQLSVGATALAAAILKGNGMLEDLSVVLDNPEDALDAANLAMHAAITSDKTYEASVESKMQKFIGDGCLSSPRASEFFQRIGQSHTLSTKMAKARSKRVPQGAILAIDGTELASYSKNIELTALGKTKQATFGTQINVSLLVNAETGDAITYRTYAGNTHDISSLKDLRVLWLDCGLTDKQATLAGDRGYFSLQEAAALDHDGFRFVFGTKATFKFTQDIINDRNTELYMARNWIDGHGCYGIKDVVVVDSAQGGSIKLSTYVYRSTAAQEEEIEKLRGSLAQYEIDWKQAKAAQRQKMREDKLYEFFEEPRKGQLKLNEELLDEECYMKGFYTMAGNVDMSVAEALDFYHRRSRIEIDFKLLFEHLMRSSRVHSTAAFEGIMLVTFAGLSILTYMNRQMEKAFPNERAESGMSVIKKLYTIQELFKDLRRIRLAYNAKGQPRLINVVRRDRDIVAALGFPGLYDDPVGIQKLLSTEDWIHHLEQKW